MHGVSTGTCRENTLDFLEMARDAGDYKLPQRARGSLCLAGAASTPAYSHDGAGVVRFLRVVQCALAFSLTNDAISNCPLGGIPTPYCRTSMASDKVSSRMVVPGISRDPAISHAILGEESQTM